MSCDRCLIVLTASQAYERDSSEIYNLLIPSGFLTNILNVIRLTPNKWHVFRWSFRNRLILVYFH